MAADGVRNATGRDRAKWFSLLDQRRATDTTYRERAAYLTDQHGMSRWWAQSSSSNTSRRAGCAPGVRPDGTLTATATKTIAAPAERVFSAVAERRGLWLVDLALHLRDSDAPRKVRFDGGDASRVTVTLLEKGDKVQVTVEHSRLSDQGAAAGAKQLWRDRLLSLKELVERS